MQDTIFLNVSVSTTLYSWIRKIIYKNIFPSFRNLK